MSYISDLWKSKKGPCVSVRTRYYKQEPVSISEHELAFSTQDKVDETASLDNALGFDKETRSWWKDTWLLEALSTVGSVLTFTAIVAILRHYDQQPIPKLPLGATLNGVISLLATTSKAMILATIAAAIGQYRWLRFAGRHPQKLGDLQVFDDASRGPRGSSTLLFSSQLFAGRLKSFVILGCVLTILALGFDPAVQSLIRTDVRVTYSEDLNGASL